MNVECNKVIIVIWNVKGQRITHGPDRQGHVELFFDLQPLSMTLTLAINLVLVGNSVIVKVNTAAKLCENQTI